MRMGIDVLEVHELDRLITRDWFRRFSFTPAEIADADSLGTARRREFLAGRFAAKEAVLKALGSGYLQGIRPAEIELVRDRSGEPTVRLHGAARSAAAERGLDEVMVTLSHKRDLVVAVALGYQPAAGHGGAR